MCERWVHDPYFRCFTGETFFQHAFPHERSGMTHWGRRIEERLDALLVESLRVAHGAGALKARNLERISVDTTMQPKAISFRTDVKLMYKAIAKLGRLARWHGVDLRQCYRRAALMVGRHTPTPSSSSDMSVRFVSCAPGSAG